MFIKLTRLTKRVTTIQEKYIARGYRYLDTGIPRQTVGGGHNKVCSVLHCICYYLLLSNYVIHP